MAKERTAQRDLAVALHPVVSVQGWDFCPNSNCSAAMVATLEDVRKVPAGTPVFLAEFSHGKVPAADGGTTGALECGACNRDRGRAPWDIPAGVPTVTGTAGAWGAYRAARARRNAYAESRLR